MSILHHDYLDEVCRLEQSALKYYAYYFYFLDHFLLVKIESSSFWWMLDVCPWLSFNRNSPHTFYCVFYTLPVSLSFFEKKLQTQLFFMGLMIFFLKKI